MINALKCLYRLPCKKAIASALSNPQGLRYCPELHLALRAGGRTAGKAVTTTAAKTTPTVSKTVTPVQNTVVAKGAKAAAETSGTALERTLQKVTQNSRYTKEETEFAIGILEESNQCPELAKALRASGDLYTMDEIIQMQEMFGNYPLSNIIRYRGNPTQMASAASADKSLNDYSLGRFKKYIDDYVNACEKFKAQEAGALEQQLRIINQGIRQEGSKSPQTILFRGELSESQIARMSAIYEAQQAAGQRLVYYPNHLISTSIRKEAISGKGHYADKCLLEIEVPETARVLDVNKVLPSKNKFSWQEEFILPSDSGFEILSRKVDGDRILFRLRML